jgi:hypothetical protein
VTTVLKGLAENYFQQCCHVWQTYWNPYMKSEGDFNDNICTTHLHYTILLPSRSQWPPSKESHRLYRIRN